MQSDGGAGAQAGEQQVVGGRADALAARDRARCGAVAPSDGLYLTGVTYEAEA